MSKRQKGTPSYSMPRDKRPRRPIEITLSAEAHEKLERIAAESGASRSQVVESLVLSRKQKK